MLEDVKARLTSFGYTVAESDEGIINLIIEKIESKIKNECNTNEVPKELHHVAVDMVCGEFLLIQKNTGKLDIDETLKSLKDGNITITYDEKSSDEAKMNVLIDYLINGGRGEIACYRTIKW